MVIGRFKVQGELAKKIAAQTVSVITGKQGKAIKFGRTRSERKKGRKRLSPQGNGGWPRGNNAANFSKGV